LCWTLEDSIDGRRSGWRQQWQLYAMAICSMHYSSYGCFIFRVLYSTANLHVLVVDVEIGFVLNMPLPPFVWAYTNLNMLYFHGSVL
jgi:hypothetical protein